MNNAKPGTAWAAYVKDGVIHFTLKSVSEDNNLDYSSDEVDTGISGGTANVVGLRMKRIAKTHQVLCVTHLPQIAAFGPARVPLPINSLTGPIWTFLGSARSGE